VCWQTALRQSEKKGGEESSSWSGRRERVEEKIQCSRKRGGKVKRARGLVDRCIGVGKRDISSTGSQKGPDTGNKVGKGQQY